jgi:hypothetical protein
LLSLAAQKGYEDRSGMTNAQMIVGSVLAAGLCGSAAFGACARGTGEPMLPPGGGTAPPPASVAAPVRASGTPEAGAPDRLAAARAAASCDQPLTAIVNHPDAGVVFNNAMTSADAGSIDRTRGVLDALAERAHQFRCCFDRWTRSHPDKEHEAMLVVTLDPGGVVEAAHIDATRSTVDDEATTACITLVARETRYPPSPTGKQTIVEYPFRVAAMGP